MAARQLAKNLGFLFLDTGAMYRAVTLAAVRKQIDWLDTDALAKIAHEINLQLTDDRITLDGQDVSTDIRTLEITTLTRHAADNQDVRNHLTQLQRNIADGKNVVTEGRDQASVVFPDAQCKIYLTATDEVRAQRRYEDLLSRGEKVTLPEVLEKQIQRDKRDQDRKFGGLRKTANSIELCTDALTPDQVVTQLEQIVKQAQ